MSHWIRVIHNGKYQYVLVDNANRPVQFNHNTGYFKSYSQPSTKSQSFNAYLSPEQSVKPNKQTNVYGTKSNPTPLSGVTITPTKYVGIQRTPDDHTAALMRDQAVDAKVNPANDQLQNFFANLMTGGMYSAVSEGADNISKGNYVKGAAQMATPIMFGPAESTVANLIRFGVGAYDLLNDNGVKKTYNLAKQGNWSGAAQSAAGDALNLGMTISGGYNLGKYNIPSAINYAAKNGNNTARSYLINKELNQNIKNFDGTVGEEYFQNPVPGRWVRISETPEVEGLKEMGKNVTTTDAYNIHVPANDWRMNHIKDFVFKDGQWYKKPKKRFSIVKFGSAHGDTSQAAYGKVWEGTTAQSRQFPQVRLEGEAPNQMYRGFNPVTGTDSRTNFVLQNTEDIPLGSRIGFHTGEMPMENLQYFQQLPNGRWKIMGQILPNKTLYINTTKTVEPKNVDLFSTSLSTANKQPYYLQFGQNSGTQMISDIKAGRKEFIDWMNNPEYRKAAEQNRWEALSMGLSYTPTYERQQYSNFLQNGIKPVFKQDMYGEGSTSYFGAQPNTPTEINYNLRSTQPYSQVTRHESGHAAYHGMASTKKELEFLKYKISKAFKPDASVGPYDFNLQTGEAAMNGRDLGADLGIAVGQKYPGYENALQLLNTAVDKSNKAGMLEVLKTDKESMPYVWKLLNGTLLGGAAFTTYNLSNGKN